MSSYIFFAFELSPPEFIIALKKLCASSTINNLLSNPCGKKPPPDVFVFDAFEAFNAFAFFNVFAFFNAFSDLGAKSKSLRLPMLSICEDELYASILTK